MKLKSNRTGDICDADGCLNQSMHRVTYKEDLKLCNDCCLRLIAIKMSDTDSTPLVIEA